MRVKLGCGQYSIRRSACKFDCTDLIEGMLFVDFTSLSEWKLDEFETVALHQRCPSRQRLANELDRCACPVDLYVIAVVGVMYTIWIELADSLCGQGPLLPYHNAG